MISLKSPLIPASLSKLGPSRTNRRNSSQSASTAAERSIFSVASGNQTPSSVITMDQNNPVDNGVSSDDDHGSNISAIEEPAAEQPKPTTPPHITAGKRVLTSMQPELTIKTPNAQFFGSMPRSDDDAPQSVIHAPPGFGDFIGKTGPTQIHRQNDGQATSAAGDANIKETIVSNDRVANKKSANSPASPPPLTTTIPPANDWSDRATPRAQTRQEIEDLDRRHSTSLEDIPEGNDADPPPPASVASNSPVAMITVNADPTPRKRFSFPNTGIHTRKDETIALWTALDECWTFCNTLANLSSNHRERLFNSTSKGDMQELAWKSCWKLCRKLYEGREVDYASQVDPTLDLCRDFCQALFEVRARENEDADSVLRVSFELNNHLYNASDHNLPPVFRERTLDFYITLCHRLMKQRMHLEEETDSLLHACWSLAEMLFSIRQSKREGKNPDEELLGSAIQACWELCDLFREGWTQIRPDRGTPRPSQINFSEAMQKARESPVMIVDEDSASQLNPETPTTIFEDTATISPEDAPIPNILVLGHAQAVQASQNKWSSSSSTLSGRSRTSEHTSSTNTVVTSAEDPNIIRLKLLITKAAMDTGYQRGGNQTLSSFSKSLSSDSFGTMPWQVSLLEQYKKLVTTDPAFRVIGAPGLVGAVDVARAVQSMVQNGQYTWLRDLYRLVFGFHVEEAVGRRNVTIQT
ncbi:hypothetical protein TMatcc_010620 [Talaromyces marneffei ATCC 18224]|nr:uncharacterized protein EYB26_009609 [Talaromyces marneffei]KAE8548556.1 hypothetical protein EYB25_008934 [Talaromyces marneffei]QGA21898.1 hypothetical protein EYB26_009609 [Talaromyces marneffei]